MRRLAWLLLLGCADSDPTVVVYDGLDDEPGRMVVAQAEKELPFTVKRLGDTEATKTAGLVQRLRQEASSPQANIFVCGEPLSVAALSRRRAVASGWGSPGRTGPWIGGAFRSRPYAVPFLLAGFGQDRWRDQGLAADPRYGSTGSHLGVLRSVLGESEYRSFCLGLMEWACNW